MLAGYCFFSFFLIFFYGYQIGVNNKCLQGKDIIFWLGISLFGHTLLMARTPFGLGITLIEHLKKTQLFLQRRAPSCGGKGTRRETDTQVAHAAGGAVDASGTAHLFPGAGDGWESHLRHSASFWASKGQETQANSSHLWTRGTQEDNGQNRRIRTAVVAAAEASVNGPESCPVVPVV